LECNSNHICQPCPPTQSDRAHKLHSAAAKFMRSPSLWNQLARELAEDAKKGHKERRWLDSVVLAPGVTSLVVNHQRNTTNITHPPQTHALTTAGRKRDCVHSIDKGEPHSTDQARCHCLGERVRPPSALRERDRRGGGTRPRDYS